MLTRDPLATASLLVSHFVALFLRVVVSVTGGRYTDTPIERKIILQTGTSRISYIYRFSLFFPSGIFLSFI